MLKHLNKQNSSDSLVCVMSKDKEEYGSCNMYSP